MSEANQEQSVRNVELDSQFWQEIQRKVDSEAFVHCLTCGSCTAGCYVREVDQNFNPRRIVHQVVLGMKDYFLEHSEVPFSCNLCGLCAQTCPYGINIGDLCMALREWLVEQGVAPLPKHKMMLDDLAFVTSDEYTISLPDPDADICERVFFPGCNMPAYSPELVLETWKYLRQKMPGTGIVLRCCGALAHDLGLAAQFEGLSEKLASEVHKLGAKELITGCPDCYETIKRTHPKYHLRNLYEVLQEIGLPESVHGDGTIFTLHDSCKARWEPELQHNVRQLLENLGYQVEELNYTGEMTRCCGQGGLTIALNPFRVMNLTKLRIANAHYDMLSYCAACRETFAMHRPSLHILDLIFNPQWEEAKSKPMTPPKQRRANQLNLKATLSSQ